MTERENMIKCYWYDEQQIIETQQFYEGKKHWINRESERLQIGEEEGKEINM